MRFAIGLPNVGDFGDPGLLLELAVLAEDAGWDGCFVWDHLLYHDPSWAVADPLIVTGAVAAATQRIRLGVLMTALPRRRPWKLAKELATLDRISGGRLTVGAGIGSLPDEYASFGEDPDVAVRAEKLDEGLEIVRRSWTGEEFSFSGRHYTCDGVRMLPTPAQRPRPPVWVAGRWPNRGPFARAARWDGVMPIHADHGKGETMPPAMVAEIRDTVQAQRADPDRAFDLALEGSTENAGDDARRLAAYQRVGVTWWVEALGWWRGGTRAARARISAGPPVLPGA